MDEGELAARIDHTVLGPTTTPAAVEHALEGALEYGTNVCVPPCYVDGVRERIDEAAAGSGDAPAGEGEGSPAAVGGPDREPALVTVVGFPQGQHATDAKVSEAICAWEDGADELDVVANLGRLRAGERDAVERELTAVVEATPCPVKVIVEAGLLSESELRTVADCAVAAGASHLKTSTGFAGGPARVADVALLSEYLPVKASGGVGDFATAAAMLAAGAERIGASRGVDIVEDYRRNYAG